MALELKFALLCDHATIGANGKPIAVHIFEHFFRAPAVLKKPLPTFFILARLECSIADGTRHSIKLDLENEDNEVLQSLEFPEGVMFVPSGPGLPFAARLTMQVAGLAVPGYGSYEFVFRSKAARIGSVRFNVIKPPPQKVEK